MIENDTYAAALERMPEPHVVILGPVPCKGCGAWVEWAGLWWLGVGSTELHECEPFTLGRRMLQARSAAAWAVMPAMAAEPRWVGRLGAGLMWGTAGLAIAMCLLLIVWAS